jgi:nucleoid-associated protein YgaU
MHTEKSDPTISRHILTVSEKEILDLHQSGMIKLSERMSRVDPKLFELLGITGPAETEIAMLDKEYADYKANIDQHPENDEVMDKIERLYSECILRNRYERRIAETRTRMVMETVYIVKRGDWLVKIAELDTVYGDWRKWRLIYEANKGIMPNPNNPHLIRPGMRLVIPQN